ncbi:hypothetical protein [Devosia submarina]|uniref:SLOG domain-containing protein n=1 Tax=Devosia submarina TaxID=1173082 RepID=UPI000D356439|nr:hypothetical protein [Devosia submarina]
MAASIFLSAGIPDPKRGPQYAATADTVAIAAAVSALVHVVLGRRRLVWGGHPAITPIVWAMAEELGVEYGQWVSLYQSKLWKDEFPEDNAKFQNVTYVDAVDNDVDKSIEAMRNRMLAEHEYSAAVFIGGMKGIVDEYQLFSKLHPSATLVPVLSTGGAALEVGRMIAVEESDLQTDLDYVAVFHRHLKISVREERYVNPAWQPALAEERYWKPQTGNGFIEQ